MDTIKNTYLLEDFINTDTNKIKIKVTNKNNSIIYPIIKKKLIKDIISSFYINDTTNSFQIRNSFYDYLLDNNNIYNILVNIHKLLKVNNSIINNIDCIKIHLKKQDDTKNILFKYSYFNKIFDGSSPFELYFYHNCFIIYLYFCNTIKQSLNSTVFDKTIANSTYDIIKTMTSLMCNNSIQKEHLKTIVEL
jgi:hypothetical protein